MVVVGWLLHFCRLPLLIVASLFFFQAEDGIRDGHVTGVQTCALPIFIGLVDVRQGLHEVDDVDAVALGEDEAADLGVPASGLVPEMDAALQELAHGDDCHDGVLFLWSWARTVHPSGASAVVAQGLLLGSSPPPVGAGPGARVAVRLRPAPHGCGIEPRTVGRRALMGTRSHPDAPGAEQSLSDARDSSGACCITFSTASSPAALSPQRRARWCRPACRAAGCRA